MNLAANPTTETKPQGRSKSAARLKWARQLHLCLGTLFAPSIIFFAFTGSLQLFGLHESHPGDAYQAPAWVQKLSSIHKDQVLTKQHGPPPSSAGQQDRPPQSDEAHPLAQHGPPQPEGRRNEERGPNKLTLALKWFFLATAIGLIFSTFLGIYMAFKFNRSRALVWGMLFLGTAIPLALILMMV
jgi:hypothetical protein